MAWLQLRLEALTEQAQRLADSLAAAGAMAVSLEDAADEPLYEPPPGSEPLWTHTRVTALFAEDMPAERIAAVLQAGLGEPLDYRVERLDDRDWQAECRDRFEPRRFGERLWVCPSWHTPADPSAVNLVLDPGLAFGTGAHPTTALCLNWLSQAVLGSTVIDYGCGSGILAVAAARLGAAAVWAVDIDPQALQATIANARRNAVSERVRALPPEALPHLEADALVANILAGPLIELAPHLAARVRPGGALALSGILAGQAAEVTGAYEPWFALAAPTLADGWALIAGQRRGVRR